ncbi:MAG: HAD family hydrolase [Myxococcota bacterium]|nr:HAD family hydrolase [Myxococcota bacterium]
MNTSTFIESLGRVRAIAFDKTGTLTSGHPLVTDVIPLLGENEDEILALAASIESLSEHPLARAIVTEGARRSVKINVASNLQSVPGNGAHATVGSQTWSIGKPSLRPRAGDAVRALHGYGLDHVALIRGDTR